MLLAPATVLAAGDCAALKLKSGAAGNIEQRQDIPAGDFQPEGATRLPGLPAFCRVVAVLKPAPGSAIRIEVWMPREGWNGKLMGVGNGGFSGSISHAALAEALKRGYATASTNTGHDGASGSFALGQPEKVIDFGYRAVHEMTLAARQLTATTMRAPQHAATGMAARPVAGRACRARSAIPKTTTASSPVRRRWTGPAVRVRHCAWRRRCAPRRMHSSMPRRCRCCIAARLSSCDAIDGLADDVIESPQAAASIRRCCSARATRDRAACLPRRCRPRAPSMPRRSIPPRAGH